MLEKFKSYVSRLDFQPAWLILGIDLLVFFFSSTFVFFFQREFNITALNVAYSNVLEFILFGVIALLVSKNHHYVIRHISYTYMYNVLRCIGVQVLLLYVADRLCVYFRLREDSALNYHLLSATFSLGMLMAYRYLIRFLFFVANKKRKALRIGIFGAGSSGVLMLDLLGNNKLYHADVKVYFDDSKKRIGKKINHIPIVDAADMEHYIKVFELDEVIISPNLVSLQRKEELLTITNKAGVVLKVLADKKLWFADHDKGTKLNNIDITDLLGRDPIKTNNEEVQSLLRNKSVLVTGAAGSIGSELCRQIVKAGPVHLILLDQAESALYDLDLDLKKIDDKVVITPVLCDISNEQRLNILFDTYNIDIVFHAAAYKHVPMQEQHPYEAFKCNIEGTYLLANLAMKHLVKKFIMVSTDKAVNPTNIMGATKRTAEMYIQSCNQSPLKNNDIQFITTRFGNVLGSNGSVVPLFKRQIEKGGPVTVTHPDVIRYFMTISEACNLVLEAAAMGKGGEIFVFDMGQPVRILDLANNMIKLSGKVPGVDIKVEFTGLRDGEKLYEELLADEEVCKETYHPLIKVANVRPQDYQDIIDNFKQIFSFMNANDELGMVRQLKLLVPEYKSMHSRFSEIDNLLKDELLDEFDPLPSVGN
jgi:FlaA1/EpsC-like NDP-sugar epimerase